MNYAIMRSEKIKNFGNLGASLEHAFRDRETPNADPKLANENLNLVSDSKKEALKKLNELLPKKRRKDAVIAIEYLMTTSPEWMEKATKKEQREFFKRSMDFLEEKYGKDRVVCALVHKDEKTPHLSAYIVPLTKEGRLSAKEFIGNRTKMSADQDRFAEIVKDLGLERGVKGSKATHKRVKRYYSQINKTEKVEDLDLKIEDLEPKIKKKTVFSSKKESQEEVVKRVKGKINEHYEVIKDKALAFDSERKRGQILEKMLDDKNKKLETQETKLAEAGKLKELFSGLDKEQASEILGKIFNFKKENKEQREELTRKSQQRDDLER